MARKYVLYTHKNVFLTGRAGTGKTTMLQRLAKETRKRIAIVAPTGVAAINAGGMTIHSFFQLAPGLYLPGGHMAGGGAEQNSRAMSKHKVNILRALDLLIIDEISMVRADLLDAIDATLRRYGKPDQPFGGVQLLMIGDLQQLAPVATETEWQVLQQYYTSPYFFASTALMRTDFVCIELKKVYRQENDSFIRLLNDVRGGHPSAQTINQLNARYAPTFRPTDGQEWITLTTHNAQAARINEQRLSALQAKPATFKAKVTGDYPESSYPTDEALTLKVGTQVMFCKNDPSEDKRFFNGRIGRVVDMSKESVTVVCSRMDKPQEYERIEVKPLQWVNTKYVTDSSTGEITQEDVGSFTQIPLRTAWAITIHKSQGLTFERAIIDAGRAFSHGQVYVALSRCRTLEGIILSTPLSQATISSDPNVDGFHEYAREHTPTAESFIRDRRSFVEDILCDIFDYRAISMRLRHYSRLVEEYAGTYYPTYARTVSGTCTQLDDQLMAVGLRFQHQIHELMPAADSLSQNQHLLERIQKGMTYYAKQTASILGEMLEQEVPEIDNRVQSERLNREYDYLRRDYELKMHIFTACATQFSLDAYWNAKAQAAMVEDTAPRSSRATRKPRKERAKAADTTQRKERSAKADVSYDSIKHPAIYKALLAWRTETAREKNLPPSYILPIRTVIGISNLCPASPYELLSISGIGKKTLEAYGPDILEIVRLNAS